MWQYRSLYGESFDAGSLEALTANPAIRILFGTPVALDDAGGFTVWRTGTPMAVLLGVWAVLTAVRVTRGEEEAGRWDQLLAGRFRLTGLVAAHLGVVIAVTLVAGGVVAVAMRLAGADIEGSIRYGVALSLIGAGMAALGALTGQLIPDRRRAVALAAVVFGTGLLARVIGDGADSLHWLHWLSPFGLLSLSQPFAANQNMPLVVLLAAVLLLVGAVVLTSRRRDLQAGVLPVTDRRRAHTVLLRSLPRYAVRRSLGPLAGWGIGIGLYFLLIGLLAASLTRFLSENPQYAALAAQAGFPSLSTVEGYVAALFALLAIPIGLFAASRISAGAADEEAGRLTMVFAAPVSRQRWYLTETAAGALGCLLLAITAGVATWAGTTIVGVDLAGTAALAGTLNVLPIALAQPGRSPARARLGPAGRAADRRVALRRRIPAPGPRRKPAMAKPGQTTLTLHPPQPGALPGTRLARCSGDDCHQSHPRRNRALRIHQTRPPQLATPRLPLKAST